MLSIGRFLNSQLATDGVEHLTSTAQSLQRIATNCWCPLCHFTHFTAHYFDWSRWAPYRLLLDTLWEAYMQDQHWRSWLLATLSQTAFGLCSCISCCLTQRVRESTGLRKHFDFTLPICANSHYGDQNIAHNTGLMHELQLKKRLTSQLHHLAELSYYSSPTAWLASTNSSTQLILIQHNLTITQPKLRLTWTQLHKHIIQTQHSSSTSYHNLFAAETTSLLIQLKQHKILFYLSTYRN